MSLIATIYHHLNCIPGKIIITCIKQDFIRNLDNIATYWEANIQWISYSIPITILTAIPNYFTLSLTIIYNLFSMVWDISGYR